jgi:type I restriction-modification system DNA methylase subunit
MARLGSQAKAGFYPTPDTVCELLKAKILFDLEKGGRLLDPCCGKGKTLSRLANGAPNLTTY